MNQERLTADSLEFEGRLDGAAFGGQNVDTADAIQRQLGLLPVLQRQLADIQEKLAVLMDSYPSVDLRKEWYTPAEFAEVVGKTRYTVSEWCRLERVNATKAESGRGRSREWRISHEELERYRQSGLLALKYPGM